MTMTAQQLITGTTRTGVPIDLVLAEVYDLPTAVEVLRDLAAPRGGFGLFLACDANGHPRGDISTLASAALSAGMHWFASWGPDCERVHDIVDGHFEDLARDHEDRALAASQPLVDFPMVMTTWHDDEPLTEALDTFWSHAHPVDEQDDSGLRLVIVVSMPQAANEVRAAVKELPAR